MKSLKVALWITALGCLTAVPFIFLPWTAVKHIISWFDIEPMPEIPVMIYSFKVIFGVFGLIGIYFIILAQKPLDCGPMLDLGKL